MKKHLLGSLAIIVMLASCKKDDPQTTNSASIEGSYKLKYITAKTNATVLSGDEKSVAISDYTTTDNQGTITFNNSTLTATGLSYSVNTNAKGYLYFGGDLVDSFSYPFSFALPPSNSAAPYQLIGTDSIYFPQGSVTSGIDGMGSTQSAPGGGRYSFAGNLLTITQHVTKDSTINDSGETAHLTETGLASIVLEKQ